MENRFSTEPIYDSENIHFLINKIPEADSIILLIYRNLSIIMGIKEKVK